MVIVYGLTPFVVYYNEGSFSKQMPKVLVCIYGAAVFL